MTTTKSDLSESLRQKLDLPKSQSVAIVESLIELIKATLVKEDDVLISGFGKFCVKRKRERRGRNPQTGETIKLHPRKIVVFRCSGILRDKINNHP